MHITRLSTFAILLALAGSHARAQAPSSVHDYQRAAIPLSDVGGPRICLASSVIGAHVDTAGSKPFGKIEDVVIHPGGEVAYAVVATGGFLGLGKKESAVAWGALSCIELVPGYTWVETSDEPTDIDPEARDRSRETVHLLINKRLLEESDDLESGHWPAEANVGWTPEPGSYAAMRIDQANHGAPGSADHKKRESMICKLSDLRKQDLSEPDGTRLGEITDVGIDLSGHVSYVIVSVRGKCHMTVAVPWSALTVGDDFEKDDMRLTLPMSRTRLGQAPQVLPGKDNLPRLTNPEWIASVYGYCDVSPYWSNLGAGMQ
jgi:sporulation protein YlmC with PRC-barrel domain